MELYIRLHCWWEARNQQDIHYISNKRKARVNTFERQTVKANDHIAHIYHKNSLPRMLFHFIISILNICDEAYLPNTFLVLLKTSSLVFCTKEKCWKTFKKLYIKFNFDDQTAWGNSLVNSMYHLCMSTWQEELNKRNLFLIRRKWNIMLHSI